MEFCLKSLTLFEIVQFQILLYKSNYEEMRIHDLAPESEE
jgi:hypothetical protein